MIPSCLRPSVALLLVVLLAPSSVEGTLLKRCTEGLLRSLAEVSVIREIYNFTKIQRVHFLVSDAKRLRSSGSRLEYTAALTDALRILQQMGQTPSSKPEDFDFTENYFAETSVLLSYFPPAELLETYAGLLLNYYFSTEYCEATHPEIVGFNQVRADILGEIEAVQRERRCIDENFQNRLVRTLQRLAEYLEEEETPLPCRRNSILERGLRQLFLLESDADLVLLAHNLRVLLRRGE
jgi:hypothetical protein